MDLNNGDYVVHPSYGVGIMVTVETMNLNGDDQGLFYRVEFPKTTVWVPVEVQSVMTLRPVTPKSQLSRYRAILKSQPLDLDNGFRARKSDLENRLRLGTFQALCEVVRDLTARKQTKTLGNFEQGIWRKTFDSLVSEWATASEISVNDATREIEDILSIAN